MGPPPLTLVAKAAHRTHFAAIVALNAGTIAEKPARKTGRASEFIFASRTVLWALLNDLVLEEFTW